MSEPAPAPTPPPTGPTLEHRVDALEARYSGLVKEVQDLKEALRRLAISQAQRARARRRETW